MSPFGALPADGRGSCPVIPIHVAVQDARRLVREGVAALLDAEPDMEVVGAFADAPAVVAAGLVDVVVVGAGEDARASAPGSSARRVPFHDGGSVAELVRAIRAPASRTPEPHIPAPRTAPDVAQRRIDAPAVPQSVDAPAAPQLTSRETQVMGRVADGLSTAEVAAALGISRKSVENHKQRIFGKFGVQSQAHAVAVTAARGLLGTGRAAS